ncbi:hypothetical protein L1887_55236 [Cichorium endivia]|nr:hypothetical protein L1887_55236 [Cichorium endivia]
MSAASHEGVSKDKPSPSQQTAAFAANGLDEAAGSEQAEEKVAVNEQDSTGDAQAAAPTAPADGENVPAPGENDVKEVKDEPMEQTPSMAVDEHTDATTAEQPAASKAAAAVKTEEEEPTVDAAGKEATEGSAADAAPQSKGPAATLAEPHLSLVRSQPEAAGDRRRGGCGRSGSTVREHWIEIRLLAARTAGQAARKKGDEYLVSRGTLLEKRDKGQDNYTALTRSEIAAAWASAGRVPRRAAARTTEGTWSCRRSFRLGDEADAGSELTLLVHLDPSAPLPEPAWLRKNEVDDLLASLQQRFGRRGSRAARVFGKVEVVDPDPPPSMTTVLYEWVKESLIGSQKERRRFVDDLLRNRPRSAPVEVKKEQVEPAVGVKTEQGASEVEMDSERDARVARAYVEIVLRLLKGERAGVSAGSGEGLADVLGQATLTSSTTWAGLVMLALLQLPLDAGVAPAHVRAAVDARLMQIPHATLIRAIDLTWKDTVEAERKSAAQPAGSQQQQQQQQHGRHRHHAHGRNRSGHGAHKRKRN